MDVKDVRGPAATVLLQLLGYADQEEWQWAASGLAPEIAAALGVSPLGLGPDTPSRGTGVLALTPYGTAHGVPPGAYRV
ncbi:hypothetical protein [Streptomyces thermolineatus]|uniref:hypothetical protein n=1 Tax=Streptomyces thermolineatus TaxID=44033 RepID=UPI00384CED4C